MWPAPACRAAPSAADTPGHQTPHEEEAEKSLGGDRCWQAAVWQACTSLPGLLGLMPEPVASSSMTGKIKFRRGNQ